MPRLILLIAAMLATALTAFADEATPSLEIRDGRDATLADFLWVARPLVVFADAEADPRFREQMDLIAADAGALLDRDVVVLTDTDPAAKSALRTSLRPRGFMLALLAKDGTVVFRKPLPWDVREISRNIDKLPLRKQELSSTRNPAR